MNPLNLIILHKFFSRDDTRPEKPFLYLFSFSFPRKILPVFLRFHSPEKGKIIENVCTRCWKQIFPIYLLISLFYFQVHMKKGKSVGHRITSTTRNFPQHVTCRYKNSYKIQSVFPLADFFRLNFFRFVFVVTNLNKYKNLQLTTTRIVHVLAGQK